MNDTAKTKRIIIIVASLLLIIIAVVIGISVANQLNHPEPKKAADETAQDKPTPVTPDPEDTTEEQPAPPPATVSNDEATQAIIKKTPSLVSENGQPTFDITKSISPEPGWYIVTLKNTETKTEGARVILSNKTGTFIVVAGPGTYFSPDLVLPDSVRKALYK